MGWRPSLVCRESSTLTLPFHNAELAFPGQFVQPEVWWHFAWLPFHSSQVPFSSGNMYPGQRKKKRMVYLESPGMQRFVLCLGFILKFCRKRYITVLEKKNQKGKKVRHANKNPQEKYSWSPARCCFVTVCSVLMEVESLKTLVFGLCCFSCPRFSSVLVRKDLPHVGETALPPVPRWAELTQGSFVLKDPPLNFALNPLNFA